MPNLPGLRRKEYIRPFIAAMLGIDKRFVGPLFGVRGRIQPDLVANYLVSCGYHAPPKPRREHVRKPKR